MSGATAAGLPIPATTAAITPAWLTSALAGALGGVKVTGVEMKPVGTGQMADTLLLELEFDIEPPPSAPRRLAAKTHAADPTSRATGLALRSYEIEVRFYQQLAPQVAMRTPHCWYADVDLADGAFILLLEDMSPATQGDQVEGCHRAQAEVAIDELVRLHAGHWADPRLAELDWLHRDPEGTRAFMSGMLPVLWSGFVDRYTDRIGPEVTEAGSALMAGLGSLFAADTRPWTVVHGDYRLDNLLFGHPPAAPISVVDWQLAADGPALTDVAYFLGAGCITERRREWEHDLVARYYGRLVDAGVEGYDWDRCWLDYRRGTWSGLIVTIAATMLVERTERGDDMFMVMAHRHSAHTLDLDAPALLR